MDGKSSDLRQTISPDICIIELLQDLMDLELLEVSASLSTNNPYFDQTGIIKQKVNTIVSVLLGK